MSIETPLTSPVTPYFTSASSSAIGLPGLYARNHYVAPLRDEGEEGEGDNAGDGTGDTGDADAIDFTGEYETKKFKFPGTTKAMTAKEYGAHVSSTYLPKAQYDGTMKIMGQIADALKQNKTPARVAPVKAAAKDSDDPLSALESMELLDGKSMAGVLRQIQSGHITPLTQAVLAIGNAVKEMRGHVGSTRQREAESELGNEFRGVIQALKLPQTDSPIPGVDVVNEMLRDFYYSFEDADQVKLRGETLSKMFTERFTAQRKFFRELEKAEGVAAKARARSAMFARPGAGSSPNGKARKMLSNKERADLLFQGTAQEA